MTFKLFRKSKKDDLLKTINKYKLNYYICSFNYNFINYLKSKTKYKIGLIISLKINEKYLNNDFNFNSINYLYNKKIPNKETFRWTINKKENIKQNENIITDYPKLIYNAIKKP